METSKIPHESQGSDQITRDHRDHLFGLPRKNGKNYENRRFSQPKQCTIIREIPKNYHTFALFDFPKIGNLMTPDKSSLKRAPSKGRGPLWRHRVADCRPHCHTAPWNFRGIPARNPWLPVPPCKFCSFYMYIIKDMCIDVYIYIYSRIVLIILNVA